MSNWIKAGMIASGLLLGLGGCGSDAPTCTVSCEADTDCPGSYARFLSVATGSLPS